MNSMPIIRVRDVMSTDFRFVDGLISIKEALAVFRENRVEALIIHKRHEDDENGILLLSDIAKEVLAKDRAPERISVYEIMSKPVLPVSADMNIRYCARLFDSFGLSLAPVVENNEIVGIVSYTDIVLNGLAAALDSPESS